MSFECLRFGSHVRHPFARLSSIELWLATFAYIPIDWNFVSRSCLLQFFALILDILQKLICWQITNVFLA